MSKQILKLVDCRRQILSSWCHPIFAAGLLAGLSIVLSSTAQAASGTWTQTTSGGLWDTTTNWSGGTVANGDTFTANFNTIDITADNTVHLDSSHTISTLIFGDTATGTAAGWTLDNNGSAANILTLGSSPTITVNTLGTNKAATISAVIDGTTGLTVNGQGSLILTGTNTFTGTTLVTGGGASAYPVPAFNVAANLVLNNASGASIQGNLTIGNSGAGRSIVVTKAANQFGANSVVTLNSTGSVYAGYSWLELYGNNQTIAGLISTGGGGNAAAIENTEAETGIGNSTLTINTAPATSYTYGGIIRNGGSGTIGVTKTGTGTQTLSGNSLTYTGTTTVSQGRLVISGNSLSSPVLSIAGGGTLEISTTGGGGVGAVTSISGAGTYQKTGAGIWDMTWNPSASKTVSMGSGGLIDVQVGTLRLGYGYNSDWTSNLADMNVASGAIFDVWDNETAAGVRVDALTGGATAIVRKNSGSGTSILSVGWDGGSGTYDGVISNSTGTLNLAKTGVGTQTLTGANTYNGTTTISGGTISAGNIVVSGGNSNLGNSATAVVLGDASNQGTLSYTGGAAAYTRGFTINAGGGQLTHAGTASTTLTVQTGGIAAGGLFTVGGASTKDITISSLISSTGGLTKTGADTVTLSNGSNSYSGKTTVANGTLSFNGGNVTATANQVLGTNTAVDLGVAATSSGTLVYTGGAGTLAKNINALGNGSDTIQNTGSGLLTLTGTLTKNGTTLTLKGGANGITVSGAGNITGASANSDLIIDGGVTTLATADTYNGPTYIINGATLNANAANALPTSPARSAVLMDQTGSGNSTLALGADQFILSLTGASTSSVNLNANTLTIGTTSGSTTFAGVISGATGKLTKDGASTQVLSGTTANTYGGLTTVSAGELDLGKTANVNAIAGGGLTVGTATNTAALVKYTGTSTDTMGAGAVTLNGQGQLDFNGVSDTIGNVAIVATGATAGSTPIKNTAGGGTLTIGTLGITPVAGFTSTINPGTGTLKLGGTVTFTAATTGQAAITGNVDLNAGQTFNIGLGTGTGFDLDINGVVSNGTLTQSTGTGRLRLSGATANTYSGTTTVNAGSLYLNKSGGVAAISGPVTFVNTSSPNLRMSASSQFASGVVLSFTGTSGNARFDLNGSSQTLAGLSSTYAGSVVQNQGLVAAETTTAGTLTINNSADYSFTGFLRDQDNGGTTLKLNLIKTGAGTQTLSGSQITYSGATTVSQGRLFFNVSGNTSTSSVTISSGATLEVNPTADGIVNFNVNYSGGGTLLKTGTKIWGINYDNVSTGDNTVSFSSGALIDIQGGTIRLDYGGGNWTTNKSDLNIATGATFDMWDNTTGVFVNALTGGGTFIKATAYPGGNGTLTLGIDNGGGTFSGVLANGTGSPVGVLSLTKSGNGTQTLSGTTANTYSGLTTVSAGELDLGKTANVNAIAGGGLTVGTATNTAALVKYTGTSTDTMGAGAVTLNGQGRLDFNGVSDTIGNVSIVATGATAGSTPITNTAGGGTLTIGTLGITPVAGFTSTINPGTGTLKFGGTVTFTAATTGQAAITGNVDLNAGQTFNIGLGTGTGYDLDINGVVSNGTLTQSTGTGRLRLSGATANTYSGQTTVNAGELDLNKSANINAIGGNLTIGDGTGGANADVVKLLANGQIISTAAVLINGTTGKLDLNGNTQTIGSLADTGTVTAGGSSVSLGTSGALTVGDATASTTFSGVISGTSGTLTKQGSGILVLAGTNANTFSGLTTVSNGELDLGKTGVNAIGGNLTVSGGTAKLTGTGGDQIANTGNVVVSSGTFNIQGISEMVAGVQLTGGNISGSGGTLTSTSTFDMQAGSASAILGGSVGLNKTTAGTVTLSGANSYSGNITVNGGNLIASAAVGGANPTTSSLGAPNTARTITVNNGGTLTFGANDMFGSHASTMNVALDIEAGGTVTNSGSFFDALGAITLNGGTLTATGGANASFPSYGLKGTVTAGGATTSTISASGTNAGVSLGEAAVTGTTFDVGTSSTLNISAKLQDGMNTAGSATQASSLTKTSAGTLTLSGANIYTGTTTVSAGVLQAGSTTAFGPAANASIAFDAGSTGKVQLNGNSMTVVGLTTNATVGTPIVESGSGTAGTDTLTVNNAGANIFAGVLQNGSTRLLALTKGGAGTLTLSGANTFTGTTILNNAGGTFTGGSTVILANTTGAAVQGNVTIGNNTGGSVGAVLTMGAANQFGANSVVTINNPSSGFSYFILNGFNQSIAGLATTGASNSQTMEVEETGTGKTSTLTINNASDYTFSGQIRNNFVGTADTLNIIKTGAGTQELSGSSILYTGTTTVNDGTLKLTNTAGFRSATSIASGKTAELAASSDWVIGNGAAFSGTGTLKKTGANVISLGGNDYSTTVSLGSNGLIDIQAGKIRLDFGYNKTSWASNLADMNIAGGGTFDIWDYGQSAGAFVKIDALTGTGTIDRGITGTTTGGLELGVDNGTGSFGGTIQNSVAGSTISLKKSGTGTQTLSGANTYSGTTTVNAGTLKSGANSTLPSGSAVTVSGTGAGVTATLDLAGFNNTIASLTLGGSTTTSGAAVTTGAGTLTLGGNVNYTSTNNPLGATISGKLNLGGATRTFTVNDSSTAASDLSISAVIDNGSLIKDGGGRLTFTGANTYTGTTTINNAGAGFDTGSNLTLANTTGAAIQGNVTIGNNTGGTSNGAVLSMGAANQFGSSSVVTINNPASGYSYFVLNGYSQTIAGLVATGTNNAQTIENEETGTGTTSTLTINNSADYTFNGLIRSNFVGAADTLNLTKTGSGTQTLGGTLTYTGATTVSNGRLVVSGNSLSSPVLSIASGATLEISTTGSGGVGAPTSISGAGTYLKTGTGIWDMTWGPQAKTISMGSGGLIDVQTGTLRLGYGYNSDWTSNLANLNIASGATFDIWDNTSGVFVNALTGGGTVHNNDGTLLVFHTVILTTGVANGSGDFSGVIQNGGAIGVVSLAKNGSGTQTLSGTAPNTYSGNTLVNAGELDLNKTAGVNSIGGSTLYIGDAIGAANSAKVKLLAANQLPNSFDLFIASDGTFEMNGYSEEVSGLWDGTGSTSGVVTSSAGTPTLTLNFGGDFAGSLTGSLALTKTGSDTQILRGNNTHTGNTTINVGKLQLINAGSNNTIASSPVISVASGAFLSVSGLAGTADLILASGQTLKGTGTVQGALTVGTGSKLAPGNSPGTINDVGNVTYASGGTYVWEVNKATGGTAGSDPGWDLQNITSGSLTIASSPGSFPANTFKIDITSLTLANSPGNADSFNKYADYTWTIASATGGISGFAANKFFLDTTNFSNDFTGTTSAGVFGITTSGNNLQLTYAAAVDAAPTNAYWKGDMNTAWNTLNAGDTNWATTFAGTTDTHATPGGGTSNVFFSSTGVSGSVTTTLGQNTSINSLTFNSTATGAVTISGSGVNTLTIGSGGITVNSGSGAHVIASDVILAGGQSWTNNSSNVFTVSGNITNGSNTLTIAGTGNTALSGALGNGNGGLTKQGTGTLTLSGTNTYSGQTDVQQGTLAYGASNVLAGSVKVSGGTLNIGTFSDTVGGVQLTSGVISGSTGILTSTIAIDVQSGSISAILDRSGPGDGLVKTTSGTVVLSGANVYSGDTRISQGVLQLGASGVISNISNVVMDPTSGTATLDLGGFSETINGLSSSGAGSSVVDNSTGAGTYTLTIGSTNGGGTFAGTIKNTTGTVAITKTGNGTETLSGNNTYTGLTDVQQGTLAYGANNVIADGASVKVSGGTLGIGAFSDTVAGVQLTSGSISGSGGTLSSNSDFDVRSGSVSAKLGGSVGLTKTTAGTVILSGANTYTGLTQVAAGTLALSSATLNNNVANSAVLEVDASAFLDVTGLASTTDLVLAANQTLKGSGTVLGNLTLDDDSTISPGNSPGTITNTGNETWNGGGNYLFEMNDATGTPGSNPGWDLVSISGSLTLNNTPSNPFEILLTSLNGLSPGQAANFDPTGYFDSWLIADAGSPITTYTGFEQFVVDASAFSNPLVSGGFRVVRGDDPSIIAGDDTQLYLLYIPVPEPSTLALAAIGLVALGFVGWKKRRAR